MEFDAERKSNEVIWGDVDTSSCRDTETTPEIAAAGVIAPERRRASCFLGCRAHRRHGRQDLHQSLGDAAVASQHCQVTTVSKPIRW